MKPITYTVVLTLLLSFFFGAKTLGQTFGTNASAVWLTDCKQSNFFNTSGNALNLIGPAANVFTNANLGAHTQNSGSLILRGAEVRTFKVSGVSNVCSVRMYYRIYLQSGTPGSFNAIALPFVEDCNVLSSQFPSGGNCLLGDQKWNLVLADGTIIPYAPVNLTAFAPGNYVLEIYYDVSGSSTSTTLCNETIVLNNAGNNYKASFSIQAPVLASNNPTTCNGTEGSITINGLVAGATYAISYTDDGAAAGPANYVANGSGQVIISGLNAGIYSDFELLINGCTTNLNTGIILSNPVFTPTFSAIPSFCAGTTAPLLPTTSNNGISGTWNPSVINNLSSGSYVFTPAAGQCALPATRNVTVIPPVTPTFSFGTSLSICAGAAVPALPTTSANSITGTWSPSSVDNQNTATYTFTPTAGLCASPTTFAVTVTPNIIPTFSFGSSLSICAGAAVPTLPATSTNSISGTWSPSIVDDQNSATYIFTPAAGVCATPVTFSVTVTQNTIPTFSFGTSLSICAGTAVPLLPNTSMNAVTGTWSPSTVDNQNSGAYIFTPTGGVCPLPVTFTVTVAPNITPTFSFGTSLTICSGGTVPTLPAASNNSINGTWSPSSVDNQNSGTYTFTPSTGQCATTASFSVTVNPNITPTFSFGTSQTICEGANAPILPTTSVNGITGTWSPSTVSNQNSGTYTFTPTAGLCATITTFAVTVNPNITPTFSFGNSLTICAGASVPTLPSSSDNSITGTWSPASVSNQNSATYTFTPAAGLCATTASFTVTVTPNITPTFSFGKTLTICAGSVVPVLPGTSTNAISGTWTPSTVDDQNSGTYTFTPSAGVCATTASFAVMVNPIVTPTFSFGATLAICAGAAVPVLPATSTNGINGSWSPSTVDNQNSGTYTFTPAASQCATTTSFTVSVNNNTIPTFSFGTSLTICAGATVPVLPATSANGISGAWSPSSVSNQNSGTYTFTPTAGQCALTATFAVTVNPNIIPTFSFGTSLNICAGETVPSLPATSTNDITGNWSPSTVDDQNSAVYTFTPTSGLCATTTSLTVTVNPNITPTFDFGSSLTICSGSTVPALPNTSVNNVTGTWSPSIVSNQNSGSYNFTPTTGQCATTATFTVSITPTITPTFDFGTSLTICTGGTVPVLPFTSMNGIDGTWSPDVVDNQTSGNYTFSPTTTPGQCIAPVTFIVTVNPILTPTFSFGTTLNICSGSIVPLLATTSANGINGTWSPTAVSNQASGTYTFTTTPGQCATETATFTVSVTPVATVSSMINITVDDGAVIPINTLTGTPVDVNYTWTNSNTSIGLKGAGTGNIPSFTAVNKTDNPISSTITVTPITNSCTGVAKIYVITVRPLNKDVFVPNVFSPNGDGKNDELLVFGNYIDKVQMRIFNQWGQQVTMITSKEKGWDGTQRGKAQPVGVYVYELHVVMFDGRTVKMKGYITLVR